MKNESHDVRRTRPPTASELLDATLLLAREIHLEMDAGSLVKRFLSVVQQLFPARLLCVRVLDARSSERADAFAVGAELRSGLEREPISLKASSAEKTRLKSAVMESARIRVSDRWDSPFPGVFRGFAVPLVAAGELYGVVDVGYPLGVDVPAEDEASMIPMANFLSVALRNERLHRETTLLRDYQARLIEYANALILGVDRSWRIAVANRALCRLLGFTHGELIGKDIRDWLPADQRGRFSELVRGGLGDGDLRPTAADAIEVELPTKAGMSVRTVWSVATIMRQGEVQAVVAIGQDQTRLRDLQNQVVQAEKLATLGQLAAGVVHEINNPLTSISVYADYLSKKLERALAGDRNLELGEEDAAKLRRIREGAERILNFSRELVQYARPAGDEVVAVFINNVVKQALWFCEHLFQRSGVSLRQSLPDDLPPIYAVPGQLEQVVINLVTNAVHACTGTGQAVLVSTEYRDGVVCLSVADSGPGIPEEDRDRVFEPFYTTKEGGKGTGLGLSIVKNIVTDHRGEIRVGKSSLGGAWFECRFPAADS